MLRLVGALWRFWEVRGYLTEGRNWLNAALARGEVVRAVLRVKALIGAGVLAWYQEDCDRATELLHEALSLYRRLGDERGTALALGALGSVAISRGNYEAARERFAQSLNIFRELNLKEGVANVLLNLGTVLWRGGEHAQATALLSESLALQREMGDRGGIARCLEGLAEVACAQGDYERAVKLFGAAEALREQIGAPLPPTDRTHYEGHLEIAQARLGEEAFNTAWLEAQSLPMEDARKLALATE